jgi:glucose-1-phosphate thymidylyltransferase
VWGVIPAAGVGSRIQPLAFSKELLPVGSRREGGRERPRAVSEYLVERMLAAGATRLCFVLSPGKSDIMEYYGSRIGGAHVCYTVQPEPNGLCDAVFRAIPFIPPDEPVVVGLPDTVWFPAGALRELPRDELAFLLFPVDEPRNFDVVRTRPDGQVLEIQVKPAQPASRWIWGAFAMPGDVFHRLAMLWRLREGRDEYIGTLVNAYLAQGGTATGVPAGTAYVDVGTFDGWRAALRMLGEHAGDETLASPLESR